MKWQRSIPNGGLLPRELKCRVALLQVTALAALLVAPAACSKARVPVSHGKETPPHRVAPSKREPSKDAGLRAANGSLVVAELSMTDEDLLRCVGLQSKGYEVIVSGDGDAQTFREGLRIPSMHGDARYCTPALVAVQGYGPAKPVGGCALKEDPTRSCIVAAETGGYYMERSGFRSPLRVMDFKRHITGTVVEGSFRAEIEGRSTVLDVTFRVPAKMPSMPEHLSPYFHPHLDRDVDGR